MKDVWANLLARDADSIKYPVDKAKGSAKKYNEI
jgi:hypothetical protein